VAEILENVKNNGDRALREYSAKFDKTEVGALRVTEEEIQQASSRLSDELKQAMQAAVRNIDTFHTAQILPPVDIETQPACAASRLPALSLPWACIFLEVRRRCSLPY
jgi:histidinol dehydrogenase